MELLYDLSKNTSSIVHCPYNNYHSMKRKTLELHLLKCPDKPHNFKHCFYNKMHVMIDTDLEKHEENCPNRKLMDEYLYQSEDVVRPNVTVSKEPVIEQTEELWDVPDGNEKEPIKYIDIIRNSIKPVSGLTKNQRKKNRDKVQKEFPNLDLSYNPNLSISERLDAAASRSKSMKPEENYPNRKLMDEYLYQSEDVVRPNITVSKEPVIEQTEKLWDEPDENETTTIKHIDTIQNSMKPFSGLTKNQRKKNRRKAHKEFPNLDLSHNPDLCISKILDAAASRSKSMKPEENYPNRKLMDEYLYQSEDVVRPNVTVSKEPVIEQTEKLWDEPDENETITIKHIDTIQNSMKPFSGLTKNQRKKNRRKAHKEFPNLDLSHNPDLSISDRLDATASSSKSMP